jgi:Uma2 family endonuclease
MVVARPLTAEEFAALPESERAELVDGEVIPEMPAARGHGAVVASLMHALKCWIEAGNSGYVATEEGVVVQRNPDRVRGPDVLYMTSSKAGSQQEGNYWELAPDLVAEVISSNETADEVRKKLADYLSIGTAYVVLVFPATLEVEVHTQDGSARRYNQGDILEFAALPGFKLEVGRLLESWEVPR